MEMRLKTKNPYTSTILKYKQNEKIKHNKAVATFTNDRIPNLER
jgi:hypothetical protein